MTTTYTHRADVLRHSKTVNGNTLIHAWDRGNIVLEYRETGNLLPTVINRFNRANGQLVSSQHHGVYLHNARGDVVQRVDVNGNVLYTYRFDAFGNQLLPNDMPDHNPLTVAQNTTNTNTNPFRFAGEYLDFETGNIYLRARYFNPRTGRFTQEDPHWGLHNMQSNALAILQSSNLYAGMLNNPIRWVDPSGESVIPAFILVPTRPQFSPPNVYIWFGDEYVLIPRNAQVSPTVLAEIPVIQRFILSPQGQRVGQAILDAILLGYGLDAIIDAFGSAQPQGTVTVSGTNSAHRAQSGSGNAQGPAMGSLGGSAPGDPGNWNRGNRNDRDRHDSLDTGVNFTNTTAARMKDPNRHVPVQTLIDAIKRGSVRPDPQGTNATMHTIEMFRNGKRYTLEVLYTGLEIQFYISCIGEKIMTKREQLYYLLESFVRDEYSVETFCIAFEEVFYPDVPYDELSSNELISFEALGKVVTRFSAFEEDHMAYPDVYFGENEVREAIITVTNKLINYFGF